ncbi:hypothetical protein TNCV_4714981 [Trichonephila clavipes]|nr:hypothetical protein TNCV_4714981 [Trichonephila clavipes]
MDKIPSLMARPSGHGHEFVTCVVELQARAAEGSFCGEPDVS